MMCPWPWPWPRPPPCGAAFAEGAVNVTAAAKARVIEKNPSILNYSLLPGGVRLPDCRRDCAADRRFKFHKRGQLFIRTHNEALSIVAMRVSNEDCSPFRIRDCNAAPTPSGVAEIVSDDFPVFHTTDYLSPNHRSGVN